MYCTKCGNALKDEDLFCSKCGTAVNHHSSEESPSLLNHRNTANDNMVFRSEDLKRLQQILAETEDQSVQSEYKKEEPSRFGNMKDKFFGKISENKVKKNLNTVLQEPERPEIPEDLADPFLTGYISQEELNRQFKKEGIGAEKKEDIRTKSKNYSKLFLRIVIIGVILGAVFGMIINLTLGLI